MPPTLSLLITHHRYLEPAYLEWQIQSLNAQSTSDFQVIYLHQGHDNASLKQALLQASFPYQVLSLPYPEIAGVCCWDLVSIVGELLMQSAWGAYWTYLHQECLPAPDFVAEVLHGIQASEAEYGSQAVYRVNQLRCRLLPADLSAGKGLDELPQSQAISWIDRTPYQRRFLFRKAPWSEDAFVLPVALSRQYHLFSAVRFPLWFQDLFDLFLQLEDKIWFKEVHWIHLGHPVIYHLNHPRQFLEYTQTFLKAVRLHPELFQHLALFELAQEDFDYQEGFEPDGERVIPQHLHRFVQYMRYADRGTMSLWIRTLDQYHAS
ncbi:hypothetical protein COW64_06420 [bacterium (Candidatus Blackallbacteria) CG18_big_fil_WC_8_21_14_2_50_49_26]|nr:MAG: hypothetical protein COW64_06420 [bacterium (Candidatus Blackallbacteria) CG18_big_fil_WC_8_21_14_2_50_49_26]